MSAVGGGGAAAQSVLPAMLGDRESRMAARRKRREDKERAKLKQEEEEKVKSSVKQEQLSEKQVKESKTVLAHMTHEGVESIMAVSATANQQEAARRLVAEDNAVNRQQRILEEAQLSTERNAAIALRWATLFDKTVPQELAEALKEQQSACERVLKAKDEVVAQLQRELRSSDEQYVQSLRQQADDIDQILARMNDHFQQMVDEFGKQLHQIEIAFMQQRQVAMEEQLAEIDQLLEKRKTMETTFMRVRQKRQQDNQQELHAIRTQDAEELAALKIRLESEIQGLEQQLEEMRATYLLNSEQLLFNYRVLKQREAENVATKASQKKKLAKLQDQLSSLMAKYRQREKEFRQQNIDVTESYRRVTEQYKDMQLKLLHFQQQDKMRFRQLWELGEGQARQVADRLLDADRVIAEQLLALKWQPPAEDVFTYEKRSALDFMHSVEDETDAKSTATGHESQASRKDVLRRVMDMLASEAEFLLDAKDHAVIASVAGDEQQRHMVKVDRVLKSIGAVNEEHIERMLPYFLRDRESGTLIPPAEAMEALRRFVDDHKPMLKIGKPAAAALGVTASEDGAEGEGAAAAGTSGAAQASSDKHDKYETKMQIREFWQRVADVVPSSEYHVWKATERAAEQYHTTLTRRQELMNKSADLAHQNEQLKLLLNQYLSSKVNDMLHVPPSQLLTMQQAAPASRSTAGSRRMPTAQQSFM